MGRTHEFSRNHVEPRHSGRPVGTTPLTEAASIAHDLNNLMFVVVAFAQQIDQSAERGGETEAAARQILSASERVALLADRLGAVAHTVDEDAILVRPSTCTPDPPLARP